MCKNRRFFATLKLLLWHNYGQCQELWHQRRNFAFDTSLSIFIILRNVQAEFGKVYTWKLSKISHSENKQDCIPVGRVPPARWPYLPVCSAGGGILLLGWFSFQGGLLPGLSPRQGGLLGGGFCFQGVLLLGGLLPCLLGRGVSLAGGSPWQGGLLGRGVRWQGGLLGRGFSLAGGSPWQGVREGLLPRGCSFWGASFGGVLLPGGLLLGGLLGRGVSLAGGSPSGGSSSGGPPSGGVSLAGESPWQGVSLAGGILLPRGGLLGRPPVNRMTDTCKNITLPQLRCRR